MSVTLEAPRADEGTGERQGGRVTRVVVQQRQRLFREGITQLLAAEHDIEVAGVAATDHELLRACQDHRPGVVLLEATGTDWDPVRLVAAVRRALPHVTVVGLAGAQPTNQELARARRGGMSALVGRDLGITGILAALRTSANGPARDRMASLGTTAPVPASPPTMLTDRELEVLSLVAAGLTSIAVANRLLISHKTVENHKQRIFAKLGVQNQAHAVSVAMRRGLMRPERVIGLSRAD